MKNKIIQNLKTIKIMKSCGYKDADIAAYCGVPTKDFIDIINSDEVLKATYELASEQLASEIERMFVENVLKQLANGDNSDAKFILERTNKKYQKKDVVDLNIKTIDDVIRENS